MNTTTATPAIEALCALVDATNTEPTTGPEGFEVGDHAYVYSRGMYRRGIITKVGRTRATVSYTTETAIKDAKLAAFNRNYEGGPLVTNKDQSMGLVVVTSRP